MIDYKKNTLIFSVLLSCTLSLAGYRIHVPLENLNGGRLPNGSIIIGENSDQSENNNTLPTVLNFGLSKDIINLGESITVNWSSEHADYVTLSDTPAIHRNPNDSYTFNPSTVGNGSITVSSFNKDGNAGDNKTLTYTVNSKSPIIYSVIPSSFWSSKVLLTNDNSQVTLVGKNIDCIKWEVSFSVNNKCYDVKSISISDPYFNINSYSEDSEGNQTVVVTPITGNIGISGTGVTYFGFQPFSNDQSLFGDVKRFSYNVTNNAYMTILNSGVYKYYGQFSYSGDMAVSIPAGTQLNFKLMAGSEMFFEDQNSSLTFLTNKPVIVGPYSSGTTITLNLKTTRYAYDKGVYIGNWTKQNMGTTDYVLRIKFE